MSIYRQTKAINLRRSNIGEHDRRYIFYTEKYGKLSAMGRGTNKVLSKLAGSLEPFQLIDFTFASGKSQNTVIAADVMTAHAKLRSNEKKLSQANFIIEIIDLMMEEWQADSMIWRLVNNTIKFIDDGKSVSKIIGPYFVIRLFTILGTAPDLAYCSSCHKKLKEEYNYYRKNNNQLVCPACGGDIELNVNVQKAVRTMARGEDELANKMKIKNEDIKIISKVSSLMLNNNLDQQVNSAQLLRYLNGS